MRVVVSLSTIPSRVPHLKKIFEALLNQTYPIDQIYLNLPHWSKRENCPYPEPPSDPRIRVLRCEDYGPITKLVPVLEVEKDPDTIIITVDDDVDYVPRKIEKLVSWCKEYPEAAIGSRGVIAGAGWNFFGWIIAPKEVTAVSVIEGVSGCAYRRKFFTDDLLDYTGAPKEAFYHDDFWISGHLAQKGIIRLVHPDSGGSGTKLELPNGLSQNFLSFIMKLLPLLSYFQNRGLFQEPQVAPTYKILGFWGFIALLLLIILVLLILFVGAK